MKMGQKTNDLLALWAECLANPPTVTGCVARARFESPEAAKAAKIALYKLRQRAKKASKRNLSPDEPGYDTSPWDGFRIEHPGCDRNGVGGGNELHIYVLGNTGLTFEILPP